MEDHYIYNSLSPFHNIISVTSISPVDDKDLIGEIKNYPKELIQEMKEEQVRQGNHPDITVFQKKITANKKDGGFNWKDSIKGENYWYYMIKNPNKYNTDEITKLHVKDKDIIKDISSLPIEIIKLMLKEQIRQGNEPNITIFQESRSSCKDKGGFSWEESKDGFEFWNEILERENFDVFFSKYKKEYNTLIKDKIIKKPIYYIVKEEDLIGKIKDFPIEVVQKMIDEQVRQGNEPNIKTYQKFGLKDDLKKQFSWRKSKYGESYWDFVKTFKCEPISYCDYKSSIHVYYGIRIYCGMIIKINELSNHINSYLVIRYKETNLALLNLENPEKGKLRFFYTVKEWNIVEILDFPREDNGIRKILYKK